MLPDITEKIKWRGHDGFQITADDLSIVVTSTDAANFKNALIDICEVKILST